jgi:hypothetical protein
MNLGGRNWKPVWLLLLNYDCLNSYAVSVLFSVIRDLCLWQWWNKLAYVVSLYFSPLISKKRRVERAVVAIEMVTLCVTVAHWSAHKGLSGSLWVVYLMTLSVAMIILYWRYGGYGALVGCILTGENWSTLRKSCPSATLSNTNPTWTALGSNLDFCGECLVATAWFMAQLRWISCQRSGLYSFSAFVLLMSC